MDDVKGGVACLDLTAPLFPVGCGFEAVAFVTEESESLSLLVLELRDFIA